MSAVNDQGQAEFKREPDQTKNLAQGVARFAQYTSPIMLAMLVSAGSNPALAVTPA